MRGKIYYDLMARLGRKLNGRYHVAVCRDDNCQVAIILIGIRYNLRSDSYVSFFFLVGVNLIPAVEACDFFLKIFA